MTPDPERERDRFVVSAAIAAVAAGVGLVASDRAGAVLLAVAGLALPALLMAAGGPVRPRWLRWVFLALAVDLVASGLVLVALRSAGAADIGGLPAALVVQIVGLWLVPFALTATAALAAGRAR